MLLNLEKEGLTDLVTGAARQELKQALLLSARSFFETRKQRTAVMWQDGSVPLSTIRPL